MILAKCIFSQSATGEVSSAYFRKLAIPYLGVGSANFRKRAPTETRLEGEEEGDEEEEEEEEEGDEEEEEEEEEEPDYRYFDSSGDEIPYVKRSRRR